MLLLSSCLIPLWFFVAELMHMSAPLRDCEEGVDRCVDARVCVCVCVSVVMWLFSSQVLLSPLHISTIASTRGTQLRRLPGRAPTLRVSVCLCVCVRALARRVRCFCCAQRRLFSEVRHLLYLHPSPPASCNTTVPHTHTHRRTPIIELADAVPSHTNAHTYIHTSTHNTRHSAPPCLVSDHTRSPSPSRPTRCRSTP